MALSALAAPLLLLAVVAVSLLRRQDGYLALSDGAAEGLRMVARIVPLLVILLTAITMLRASGALELLTNWLRPVVAWSGLPVETLPLVLIRPISGSAALAVAADLMARYGVNSRVGRTAAVMLGSTETTFYTISVYFGAAGIRKTRYAVPAALLADLTGFLVAALCENIRTI